MVSPLLAAFMVGWIMVYWHPLEQTVRVAAKAVPPESGAMAPSKSIGRASTRRLVVIVGVSRDASNSCWMPRKQGLRVFMMSFSVHYRGMSVCSVSSLLSPCARRASIRVRAVTHTHGVFAASCRLSPPPTFRSGVRARSSRVRSMVSGLSPWS